MKREHILVLLWLAVAVGLCELLAGVGWGFAVRRALLLGGLLASCGLLALLKVEPARDDRVATVLGLLAAAGLLFHAGLGVRTAQQSQRNDVILIDQGQMTWRAIELLRRGENPWGRDALLDVEGVRRLLGAPPVAGCIGGGAEADFEAWWWGGLTEQARADFEARLDTGDRCAPVGAARERLGLKYGPLLLASYAPFAPLGKAGLYVAHVAWMLVLGGLLVALGRRLGRGDPLLAALPLAVVLLPSHLRFNTLWYSAGDLAPVALALAGLLCLLRRRDVPAGLLIGASVAAKAMPGLLFLPLLLRAGWRSWLAAGLVVAAAMALPVAWDPAGAWINLGAFAFERPVDSTALAWVLGPSLAMAWKGLLAAGLLALLAWTWRRGWRDRDLLLWLLVAHAAALLGGSGFHNNYMVWLLPVVGLWAVAQLAGGEHTSTVGDG